jgi:predicted nucleic acid-binding protein
VEAARVAIGGAGSLAQQGRSGRKAVVLLNVFLDSSALAKRYVQEVGSERLDEILLSASWLGVSMICVPEIVSALCRRRRERRLSQQQYVTAKKAFFDDIEDSSIIVVTDQIAARAVELLERWPLRSSDSIHIASAAEWGAELFVSADEKQCAAARGYGLRVEELPAR